mgnify:CR=1 FL=1
MTTNYLSQFSDIDYKGATYTIGTTSDTQYPNYVGDDLNGESVNDAQFQRDAWIESNYNVHKIRRRRETHPGDQKPGNGG